jgi:hypothetical protein
MNSNRFFVRFAFSSPLQPCQYVITLPPGNSSRCPTLNLVHNDHASESYLSTLHMLNRIFHLVKRKLFNHALDTLFFGKIDRFFAVQSMTTWPSMD